jgi:hypothetical protein
MRVTSLFFASAVCVVGCSSEVAPAPANLTGTWNFTYMTAAASTANETTPTCQGTMTFIITQTDQTFVGTQQNAGTLTCQGVTLNLPSANLASNNAFTGEQIHSGVVSPNEVAFELGTLSSDNSGTVTQPGLMTGTSTWTLPIKPNGTIMVSGTWTAAREPM